MTSTEIVTEVVGERAMAANPHTIDSRARYTTVVSASEKVDDEYDDDDLDADVFADAIDFGMLFK